MQSVTDASGDFLPGTHAFFAAPTNRYGHAVLGNTPEWGQLRFVNQGPSGQKPFLQAEVTLPQSRVFEDLRPRLADLDGDGVPEIIVVESDKDQGAQLAVYGVADTKLVKRAATPFIGQRNRWLAPIGTADLNDDGRIEIAYIDRPHLAKRLRIWSFTSTGLTHLTDLNGLTNHRIGWAHIPGGIRDCGNGPELITADANWSNIMSTTLTGAWATSKPIGPYRNPDNLNAALTCP